LQLDKPWQFHAPSVAEFNAPLPPNARVLELGSVQGFG
jgi:hypothetical protein